MGGATVPGWPTGMGGGATVPWRGDCARLAHWDGRRGDCGPRCVCVQEAAMESAAVAARVTRCIVRVVVRV